MIEELIRKVYRLSQDGIKYLKYPLESVFFYRSSRRIYYNATQHPLNLHSISSLDVFMVRYLKSTHRDCRNLFSLLYGTFIKWHASWNIHFDREASSAHWGENSFNQNWGTKLERNFNKLLCVLRETFFLLLACCFNPLIWTFPQLFFHLHFISVKRFLPFFWRGDEQTNHKCTTTS